MYMSMHQRNAGDHRGKEKNNRHERRGPPGVGLHRAENKSDISVQQKCGGNADQGDDPSDAVIHAQSARADVVGAESQTGREGASIRVVDRARRTMSLR